MVEGSFRHEIEAHVQLQRRNSRLEATMPISQYRETVAAEQTDSAIASRSVAAELPNTAAAAEASAEDAAPWDDPDSWWNVRDPTFNWSP
jgi:hypothetical protein